MESRERAKLRKTDGVDEDPIANSANDMLRRNSEYVKLQPWP